MRTPSAGGAGNLREQARVLLFLKRFWHPGLWESSEGKGSTGRGSGPGLPSRTAVVPVAIGAAEEGRAHQNPAETGPFLSCRVLGPRPPGSCGACPGPFLHALASFHPHKPHKQCRLRPDVQEAGPRGRTRGHQGLRGQRNRDASRPPTAGRTAPPGTGVGGTPRPLPQLCPGDCARIASQGSAPAPAHSPHRCPTGGAAFPPRPTSHSLTHPQTVDVPSAGAEPAPCAQAQQPREVLCR